MKQIKDFTVVRTVKYNDGTADLYTLMNVTPTDGSPLPEILPGQFVQIAVDAPGVFLRRPISVNDVDRQTNTLDLLIRRAGKGTAALISLEADDQVNIMLPLGNGFSTDSLTAPGRLLLVGGGVGVAPLLYLGRCLKEKGLSPEFLLGAKSAADMQMFRLEDFNAYGPVHISTEDGSMGEKGFVTTHSVWQEPISRISCCGPAPMMKTVAAIARENGTECEVSLENMMACGLGACLCCVENTVKGNVCVCTEGPVFNINQLNW
ncbi:MAG: dihydroorotate dehydrogenase electron transfer subunit [Muribaculaceae bacterium]|nr:dihydroorotate dehydrogenase electron transfer subunit [Muribaculaceae bacterium]